MRYLTFLLITLALSACQSKQDAKEERLRHTVDSIRRQARFKPLPLNEAYDFVNQYCLPKLDSDLVERKLGIHPLLSTDTGNRFADIAGSVNVPGLMRYIRLAPPPYWTTDTSFKWSAEKLRRVIVINDTITPRYYAALDGIKRQKTTRDIDEAIRSLTEQRRSLTKKFTADFKRSFGDGYMAISYPQYNSYTNRLEIKTYLNDNGDCPVGKNNTYYFKKTANGWVEINPKQK